MPFTHLDYQKIQKRYCGILPYFSSALYLYQRMPRGLNISPSIWQSYINTILDCLKNRKYCKAVMDDLLLFTPSKSSHTDKLEDFVKGIVEKWIKNLPKEVTIFQNQSNNLWVIKYLYKIKEHV